MVSEIDFKLKPCCVPCNEKLHIKFELYEDEEINFKQLVF